MKTSQKNQKPKKETPTRKRETLQERVHRHLNDINSKITDDDIRNVKTEMEIRGEGPARSQMDTPENKKGKRKAGNQEKINDPGGVKHITPWDILDED